MTSSPDPGELPPALSSMWRLCKLGYRHEPRLMLVAFVLSQLSALRAFPTLTHACSLREFRYELKL